MYYDISFPELGLSFNPSRVAFTIGSKAIYWYGIIIAVGFLLAVLYALKRSDQFGFTQDNIIDMLLCAVPAAVVCARLYYCIFRWDLYRDNPVSMIYIWEGGLAIYGGVIGAVLGVIAYTKAKKISTAAMLDVGGLGLMIGQCIGRWGNFINREAHGGITDGFLRMGLTDSTGSTVYVHPTFLYESLWNLLGFVILHFYSKRRKYDGQIFVMYLGWYGLGRMFIEGLRTDSLYLGNTNLRVSQLLAGICLVFAVIFFFYHKVFREHEPEGLFVNRSLAAVEDVSADAHTDSDVEESTEDQKEEAGEADAGIIPDEEPAASDIVTEEDKAEEQDDPVIKSENVTEEDETSDGEAL